MQRDTLIRYLLDELHSYEEDYSESMCPFPQDEDGNFIGQTAATAPVTVVGLQAMSATMCDKMEDMSIKLHQELQETVSALCLPTQKACSGTMLGCNLYFIIVYQYLIYCFL